MARVSFSTQLTVYEERGRDNTWDLRRQVGMRSITLGCEEDRIGETLWTVTDALALRGDVCLLDLGCGNGVFTDLVFEHCVGGLGIDLSEPLISVAQRRFEQPGRQYLCAELCDYLAAETAPERSTRALCHGAFQCLPVDDASES